MVLKCRIEREIAGTEGERGKTVEETLMGRCPKERLNATTDRKSVMTAGIDLPGSESTLTPEIVMTIVITAREVEIAKVSTIKAREIERETERRIANTTKTTRKTKGRVSPTTRTRREIEMMARSTARERKRKTRRETERKKRW